MQANHPWKATPPPKLRSALTRVEMMLITAQSPLRTARLLYKRERLLAKLAHGGKR